MGQEEMKRSWRLTVHTHVLTVLQGNQVMVFISAIVLGLHAPCPHLADYSWINQGRRHVHDLVDCSGTMYF